MRIGAGCITDGAVSWAEQQTRSGKFFVNFIYLLFTVISLEFSTWPRVLRCVVHSIVPGWGRRLQESALWFFSFYFCKGKLYPTWGTPMPAYVLMIWIQTYGWMLRAPVKENAKLIKSVKLMKNVVLMCVGPGAVWQLDTWMWREGKVPWGCPNRLLVTSSCAPSKVPSVTFGMGNPSANAKTDARRNQVLPVPPTGSPTITSALWMLKLVPRESR